MDKYDLTQTVPSLSVAMMGVTFFALILVTFMFYFWVRRAYPDGKKGVFAGMASYFIICSCFLGMMYQGENALYTAITDGTMAEGQKQAISHVMQIIFIMFECAVIVVCLKFVFEKFVYQPGTYNFGNLLMFSIGFSLVDSLSWLVSTGIQWVYGTTINGIGLEEFIKNLEKEEQKEAFMESIQGLLNNGPVYYFLMFFERLIFIAFIVALMTLIYLVLMKVKEQKFLVVVWGAYVLYFIPSVLKVFGIIDSNTVLIGIATVYIALVIVYTQKQFSKNLPIQWNEYRDIQKLGLYTVLFGRGTANKSTSTKKKSSRPATVNRSAGIAKNANIARNANINKNNGDE